MNEKVAPIPAGFTTITPHLLVKDAEEAFAFYQKAFGAKELSRQTHPSENWLLHLDLKIGNSILMLSGTLPQSFGLLSLFSSCSFLLLILANCDSNLFFSPAVSLLAKSSKKEKSLFSLNARVS